MKIIFLLITMTLGVVLQGQARTVSNPEINNYKYAVNGILSSSGELLCGEWWTYVLVNHSQTLEITDGEQPLLTFSYHSKGDNGVDLFQVAITTSVDFKEIKTLTILEYVKGKVNEGTLKDPIIRDGYLPTTKGSTTCNIKQKSDLAANRIDNSKKSNSCLSQKDQEQMKTLEEEHEIAKKENPECVKAWGAAGCLSPFKLSMLGYLKSKTSLCEEKK